MKKIIEEVRKKIEMEKSNSKKSLYSSLYITLLSQLSEVEKEEELDLIKNVELIIETAPFYDYLKNDLDIFNDFSTKVNNRYEKTNYNFYSLCAENKLNIKEAKEIVSEILNDMNIENKNDLYDFEKIKYQPLEDADGCCINTFGLYKGNIVLNDKVDKIVLFIKYLIHEIGHNYENIFMSNMSARQQIERYNYSFVEVCSSFFEKVSLDYLIKNNIYMDDANRELNNYYCDLYDRIISLGEISTSSDIANILYDDENIYYINNINNSLETQSLIEQNKSEKDVIITRYNYASDIKYGYGCLIGEYFFNIYKQDKKEGLKKLKNFLANQGLLDERDMLNSINFKENDFSFLDQGLLENKKYMRKRYKW